MSAKRDTTASPHVKTAFEEKPTRTDTSGEPSPMGSNIFIVKSDSKKSSQSHTDPFRHEPITQRNIGRTILRGIRGKNFIYLIVFISICLIFLALWATRQTEKDLRKNKDLYIKTTIRELIIYLIFIIILCISKYRRRSFMSIKKSHTHFINRRSVFIVTFRKDIKFLYMTSSGVEKK